jgi:hypothetical protein
MLRDLGWSQVGHALRRIRDALSRSANTLSRCRDALSRSRDALSRSRDALSRSRDALSRFGLALSSFGLALSSFRAALSRFGHALSRFRLIEDLSSQPFSEFSDAVNRVRALSEGSELRIVKEFLVSTIPWEGPLAKLRAVLINGAKLLCVQIADIRIQRSPYVVRGVVW